MKYRTFRNIVVVVVIVGAAGGGLAVMRAVQSPPVARFAPVPLSALPPAPPPPAPAPAAVAGNGLRPVDQDALDLLARPVTTKMKDATAGRPWKINLYSDDGRRWNRLKVDLDRDQRWDESWTIKPDGAIERRAPADGPSSVYRLVGGSWQLVSSR